MSCELWWQGGRIRYELWLQGADVSCGCKAWLYAVGYGSKVEPRAVKSVAISCELRALAKKRGYERVASCELWLLRGPRAISCGCMM